MTLRTRALRRKAHHMSDVTLTPLIDTALVLLVVFMVASPMMTPGIKLNLPTGQTSENKKANDPVTIMVDPIGNYYLKNEKFSSLEDMITALTRMLAGQKEQPVFIYGDAQCSYGALYKLMDNIKYVAGIENVVLCAEKPSQR